MAQPNWMSLIFSRKHGMKIQKSSINHQRLLAFFGSFQPPISPGGRNGSLGPLATSEVTRPSHPCQLTWEVHASAEDDQKGRNSTVRRAMETLEGLWMRVLHHVSRFQFFSILGWLCNISNYVIYIYTLYIQNYIYIYIFTHYIHISTLYIYIDTLYILYIYIYIHIIYKTLYIYTLYIIHYIQYIIYNTLYMFIIYIHYI